MDKTAKTMPAVLAILLVVVLVVAVAVAIGFAQAITMLGLVGTAVVFYLLLHISAS